MEDPYVAGGSELVVLVVVESGSGRVVVSVGRVVVVGVGRVVVVGVVAATVSKN